MGLPVSENYNNPASGKVLRPVEGRITLDGMDLRDMTLDSLRRQISLVLQDTFLFNGTIAENISYARSDATLDEVIEAAKLHVSTTTLWRCRISTIRAVSEV